MGVIFGPAFTTTGSEGHTYCGRCLPTLAGMRLVYDDGKSTIPVRAPNVVENEGEFLDGRDDDLLSAFDEPAEVAGMLGVADSRTDLRELLDGVPTLLIEDVSVRHDDDRVE